MGSNASKSGSVPPSQKNMIRRVEMFSLVEEEYERGGMSRRIEVSFLFEEHWFRTKVPAPLSRRNSERRCSRHVETIELLMLCSTALRNLEGEKLSSQHEDSDGASQNMAW